MLLRAPSVVVLDEATAHLDSESEHLVQDALAHALSGRTSIVIAHRLSTVREADRIIVVDGGRVVDQGTHTELLARGGLYADLYETQFKAQASEVGTYGPSRGMSHAPGVPGANAGAMPSGTETRKTRSCSAIRA
jgi:ATP-binding cassette subfamily B protein